MLGYNELLLIADETPSAGLSVVVVIAVVVAAVESPLLDGVNTPLEPSAISATPATVINEATETPVNTRHIKIPGCILLIVV